MASSAAPAPSLQTLTGLPARPPTPPREASHEVDVYLRAAVLGRPPPFDPRHSLQTPPGAHSPVSVVAPGSDTSSDRVRKRVEWSSHTEYKEPPDYLDAARLERHRLLSTPSSASPKPIKGILKPSPAPSLLASSLAAQLDGNITQPNLVEMLDSSIKQLAGADRDSKLDAYMMLSRALKTSNNLPDRVALQNKMSLFMQFIQRDVTSRGDNGALDSSLVNHALTLLATFLHFQAIASTITSDFGLFIIDHAIRSFEDTALPKDIVRHLMQVVAFQNFSLKVMTPDRVGRLVAVLHKIEDHVQGKSIVMSRLHIYKRLIKQTRNAMLAHSDWLKDMFTDMLSTVKDIRAQAISLGTEAGFAFRPDKMLFRKFADIFTATDGDETYMSFYIARLQRMLKDRQTSFAVPQIWSVVVLFLRCPFDHWEHYAPWLRLVQDAFNMTDGPTKQEANYAWNRYVCLSILDGKLDHEAVSTLCKPLLSQLRRKTNPKQQDEAMKLRRIVLGGVCSLYYYAFARGDDKCSTEVVWDAAVQPVMMQLINLDGMSDVPGDCMMQAARMLASLLDVSTPRPPRNPDRIMDATPLKPEELLPIDPKWARRNCDKVFKAVEPILAKKFIDLSNKDSIVYRLWQALVGSVAAASAKDIKVSEDTIKFLGHSLSLLAKAWSKGLSEDDGSSNIKLPPSIFQFAQVLVDGLGVLPFMEKKLTLSIPNTFEVAAAPLQRTEKSGKLCGGPRTALQHLFSTLSAIPPGFDDNEELANLFQSVLGLFFKGRNTRARSELARELIQSLPRNALFPCGPWLMAAEHMKTCLDKGPTASVVSTHGGDKLMGPQYREMVSLLERGLASHPRLPADKWTSLFDFVSSAVFEGFGDAGRALVLIEPLAKAMFDNRVGSSSIQRSVTSTQAMTVLFDAANLPRDRKALDTARLRLWGAPPPATNPGPSDPFDNLYKLINNQMEALYELYPAPDNLPEWETLVASAFAFFERCSAVSVIRTMSKMQHALRPWIQDENDKLRLPELAPMSELLHQLWDHVCMKLVAHGRLDRRDFDQVEPLLVAALKCRQTFIVNKAAGAWNSLVRDEEQVDCSDNLKSIISSLRPGLNLAVPGIGPSSKTNFEAPVSDIGHPDMESLVLSTVTSRHDSKQDSEQAPVTTPLALKQPSARKRQTRAAPEAARKSPRRSGTSRLRHDDSQIQFAVIAPPALPMDESQHLTDRQKEVRERQLENAAIYPSICSDGPVRSDKMATSDPPEKVGGGEEGQFPRDVTPTRNTSFDDLVRSTPTPRRGQVLPIDDANDPPSSPPVPRPYPLLSEIESRSRANSSLDSWEFSSPTGSPLSKVQEVARIPMPASTTGRARVSPARRRTRKRRRPGSAAARERETRVIPSSDDHGTTSDGAKGNVAGSISKAWPSTPTRSDRASSRAKAWGQSKSGDDKGLDATDGPERASSEELEIHVAEVSDNDNASDASSSLSEGAENAAGDFVIELESRHHESSTSESGDSPGSDGASRKRRRDERILAHHESPRRPMTRRESKRLASLPTEPEPNEYVPIQATSGPMRKRKRDGAKDAETSGKKRRSEEGESARPEHEPLKTVSAPECPRHPAQQRFVAGTRRSPRRLRPQIGATSTLEATTILESEDADPEKAGTGADTDEEVMSQLVTESFAASRQSESQESARKMTRQESKRTSVKFGDAVDATTGAAKTERGRGRADEDAAAPAVLGTLRSGLEQLRSAALGREAVYQLEDVLMDLKRELYDAEKRGRRRQTRSGAGRKTRP